MEVCRELAFIPFEETEVLWWSFRIIISAVACFFDTLINTLQLYVLIQP